MVTPSLALTMVLPLLMTTGPCDTVVIPMQDVLGLDGSARMNYPGTIGGNWLWRMKPDQLSLELSMKYFNLNTETERRN